MLHVNWKVILRGNQRCELIVIQYLLQMEIFLTKLIYFFLSFKQLFNIVAESENV